MRRLILSLPIALAACATTGTNGVIAIDTISGGRPLPGAACVVTTNSGSWNVVTPGIVQVGGMNGDLHVVCNKAGYRTSELVFKPAGVYGSGYSMGLGVGGGGGHVGGGVGLSVPIATSGGGYPSRATVELRPLQ